MDVAQHMPVGSGPVGSGGDISNQQIEVDAQKGRAGGSDDQSPIEIGAGAVLASGAGAREASL
jgi:hypothetical protein